MIDQVWITKDNMNTTVPELFADIDNNEFIISVEYNRRSEDQHIMSQRASGVTKLKLLLHKVLRESEHYRKLILSFVTTNITVVTTDQCNQKLKRTYSINKYTLPEMYELYDSFTMGVKKQTAYRDILQQFIDDYGLNMTPEELAEEVINKKSA